MTGAGQEVGSADLHADERVHFMATMGFQYHVDGTEGQGQATVGEYLQTAPGWPSTAVLLTFADVLIGLLASHHTAPRISVTSHLSVAMVGTLPADGGLRLRSHLAKVGRSMTVGETEMRGAGSGELVATSIGTFLASPRPQDEVSRRAFSRVQEPGGPTSTAATLAEHVGLRLVEPGLSQIDLRPDLTNATDSLQGGLVALLGEIAAQSAASATLDGPAVVHGLDVHYLAAARAGPFEGRAQVLCPGLVKVEVRDSGRDDRLVAVITARTRPAGVT